MGLHLPLTTFAVLLVLISACSPAETAPTSTPEPTAAHTAVPTSTSIPLPTPTPVVTVEFVESITAGPDPLRLPSDLAFDGEGNFYVVDSYNQRIVKFESEGNFLSAWGSEGTGEGQFNFMDGLDGYGGIDIDSQGNVYVADTFNYRIQKFDPEGRFLEQWGGKGQADGQFNDLSYLALDRDGNIYVADTYNDRIQKFDQEGHFLLGWGGPGLRDGKFNRPYGVAVDSQGRVYVAEYKGHRIQVFDNEGNFLLKWGTSGNGEMEFRDLSNIRVGADGRIYVVDYQNNRIQVFQIVEN